MQHLLLPTHFLFIILLALLLPLALSIVAIVLVYADYQRIPPGFRKLDPGLVWLLLIPCFNVVWNFFVFPNLANSFKAYFDSIGDSSVGDCGQALGFGYAICCAASIVPFVGCLTGSASLVLLILFLVKANDLKNRIPITAGA
jgi:uncharacterized membrane protein